MKKFGFGKKKPAEAAQDNPYAQQPADNPYAQQPANDPYANAAPARTTPYQQARQNLPSGPRPGGGLPTGPRAGAGGYNTPPPPYGGADRADSGYANEKFGAAGGYGGNRYDSNAAAFNANRNAAPARQGGYGGLGDTDAQRDDLFGGAQARVQQQPQQSQFGGDDRYGGSSSSAAVSSGNPYGGYGEQRELTEEEREEQEVDDTKSQIRQLKQESLASTQRSLAIAQQTGEVATGILARLGAQGERLHNTEKNLDLAANHNRVAEEKAKELKTLNGSMFAVHVNNPFTKKSRAAERDAAILAQHQEERAVREATRRGAYETQQRMESAFKGLSVNQGNSFGKLSAAEKSKYTFEDDDGDADEEIEDNLRGISSQVELLKRAGMAIGEEVDKQNILIDRIGGKTDSVNDQTMMNRTRLERIK